MTENLNFNILQKQKTIEKFTLDEATIKFLFHRYKAYLLSFVVIVTCIFLLFKVVGSQIQDLFVLRDEAVIVKDKISVLKNNLNVLSSMDEETQNKQLQVASNTLPPYKDFAGILNAIIVATVKAGVGLNDFSFAVGDISTNSATLVKSSTLKIDLNIINTSPNQTKRFLTELSQARPLTDVETVETGGNSASLTVLFYYNPFPLITLNYYAPIKDLTTEEKKLMETIASWQTNYADLDLESLSTPINSTSSSQMSVSSQKEENESIPFASQ